MNTGTMGVFNVFLPWVFLGVLNHGCFAVSGQHDVFTTCPSSYKEGETHVINCTIDSAKVATWSCLSGRDVVLFSLTKNGFEEQVCNVAYDGSTCTSASGGSCGCVNKENDILTYRYLFVAEKQHQSQALRCTVPCITNGTPPNHGPMCAAISFRNGGKTCACCWLSLGFASLIYLFLP